ncbi:hypothetical protein [Kibdelosporangium philippinense]|uniref:hypothetical protein n=1 Tax=Kibdelosporangium philippinense TaxID=211113 RepID=UPI003623BC98
MSGPAFRVVSLSRVAMSETSRSCVSRERFRRTAASLDRLGDPKVARSACLVQIGPLVIDPVAISPCDDLVTNITVCITF